jgi:hypothetical protein
LILREARPATILLVVNPRLIAAAAGGVVLVIVIGFAILKTDDEPTASLPEPAPKELPAEAPAKSDSDGRSQQPGSQQPGSQQRPPPRLEPRTGPGDPPPTTDPDGERPWVDDGEVDPLHPPPDPNQPIRDAEHAEFLRRVREIVRRGETAANEDAEMQAGRDLMSVLQETQSMGDAAMGRAEVCLQPDEAAGVQEVGARILGAMRSAEAVEQLGRLLRTPLAPEVQLQLLRALGRSDLPFARGTILEVAQDPAVDAGVRGYALHLLRTVEGAEAILAGMARDPDEEPGVRAAALEALFDRGDLARAREVLSEVSDDEALAPFLRDLQQR